MLFDLLPLLVAAIAGLLLQRRADSERLRNTLWNANYAIVLPLAAAYAFLSIDLDRKIVAGVACSLAAWWLTVGVAYLWARSVARTRPMRGALTLIGAFPNTGFIGYPLAQLAFGTDGLRLAVIYDQLSLVVPAIVVATVIARAHANEPASSASGEPSGAATPTQTTRQLVARQLLTSPPLWAALMLITARLTIAHDPIQLDTLGTVLGHAVGPIGFLLLGLSIPLHGFTHERRDLVEIAGASIVRLMVAPLLVGGIAIATGTQVPHALYLCAAMPTAFHALVIARLHDLEVATVRLGIVITTIVGVASVVGWTALR